MHWHQWFQAYPEELCEGTAHAGRSGFCFTFSLDPIPSNAGNVWPPYSKPAHSQISAVLSDLCRWYAFFLPGSKGRTLISVKTLVHRLPDLPDLLCHPCYVHVYIRTVPIIMCLVMQWQQIVPAFICLSNLFHCFPNTLLFTCSTASSGRHT